MKSVQAAQSAADPFGLLGLLSVIRMSDPDLTSLALGIDLTTLGLNLNSTENLHKTFGSPWSDEPAKGEPEFNVPQCYYAKQPPALHVSGLFTEIFVFHSVCFYASAEFLSGGYNLQLGYFAKFTVETLFYIFYRCFSFLDFISSHLQYVKFNVIIPSCFAACPKMKPNYMLQMNCKFGLSVPYMYHIFVVIPFYLF